MIDTNQVTRKLYMFAQIDIKPRYSVLTPRKNRPNSREKYKSCCGEKSELSGPKQHIHTTTWDRDLGASYSVHP